MPLREIFNRKRKVGLKIRFEALGDYIKEWFNNWWLLFLSIFLLAIGLGLILGFQLVSVESTRWTMSALVQAGAALMGIFYVALGLLWNQANQETERLLNLFPGYMRRLSTARTPYIHNFIDFLSKIENLASDQDYSVQKILRDCCMRLVVLRTMALRYCNDKTERSIRKHIRSGLGIDFNDEEEKKIEREAFRASMDTSYFFSYINGLELCLDSLIRLGKIDWSDGEIYRREGLYTKILHQARTSDRVYVSLWKLRFTNYFKGKAIVIISALWLTCLALGLFTLFALDNIPSNLLPYIASLPLAIGMIAIGTTLTFGFRAMSIKD